MAGMGWQGVGSSGAGTARGADASGGEVKLWNTQKERELVNNKADLFALIKTVEYLERAYVRDFIRWISLSFSLCVSLSIEAIKCARMPSTHTVRY